MPVFGLLVGLSVVALQRRSVLSSDTVIGVLFSAVVAFGLAMVSRDRSVARDMQRFLYGDILTISNGEIACLAALFIAIMVFQAVGYNRMLYVGLNPALAGTHRVHVAVLPVHICGIALAGRDLFRVGGRRSAGDRDSDCAGGSRAQFRRSAGSMFWWAVLIGFTSSVAGLLVSAQDWARTATGATVVLLSFGWFLVSWLVSALRGHRMR